jgi:phosphoglycolate phosphatase
VLCVGDEIRDAEAARAVGLDFIGVSWGYTKPEALQPHSKEPLFSTPEEILALVGSAGTFPGWGSSRTMERA